MPNNFQLVITSVSIIAIIGMVIFFTIDNVNSSNIEQEHIKIPVLGDNLGENSMLSSLDNTYEIDSTPYLKILESCNDNSNFDNSVGLVFYNGTHYIDNFTCEWELVNCDLTDVTCLERNIPKYLDDIIENNLDDV